jgi:hypothetical protein
MAEPTRCWVCGRTDAEISSFADVETPRERELPQKIAQVTQFRADFIQTADAWRKGLPKELREFDFGFVTMNADQFKSIRIGGGLLGEIVIPTKLLAEILDAKKLTVDWLENVVLILRKGDGEIPGFAGLSPFEKSERDLLSEMVEQFEAKWHRYIGSGSMGADSNGYKQGFEGLKLFEGLEFTIAVGTLYYDMQAQLLEMAKKRENSSKPKKGVLVLHVSGYPPVPLCSVCVDIIKELSLRPVQAMVPPLRS